MIVQCPKCPTRYNLDDERISPEGSKVRCTRCGHVFQVSKPSEEPLSEEPTEDALDEVFNKTSVLFERPGEGSRKESGEDPSSEASPHGKKKGRGKQILFWLFLFILILVGVGIGTYYYAPHLLDNTGTGTFTGKQVDSSEQKKDVIIPEITLENVRQYFVKNEKIGQVFVLEGKAVNGFKVPKELIKLRVKLFDASDKVIASKEFLCGNVVSYFQLQVLSKAELEAALTAKVGILTNNTHLKPGTGVPFMVVFPDPPKALNEFALEPIEAKDPPE